MPCPGCVAKPNIIGWHTAVGFTELIMPQIEAFMTFRADADEYSQKKIKKYETDINKKASSSLINITKKTSNTGHGLLQGWPSKT